MNTTEVSLSKYFAFISYSHHTPDRKYARWLHKKLEAYDITTLIESSEKQKLYPICRDETAFSSGSLTDVIQQKLRESKKLIVICSHASANSVYVRDEVNFFAENFGLDNIIPILAEKCDDITEILPGVLKEHPDKLCLDRFGFEKHDDRKVLLQLIAAILDLEFESVYDRDRAKRIRSRIFTTGMIALVMSILLGISLLAGRAAMTKIIARDTDKAVITCKTDLYHGISELLQLEKQAELWHIESYDIRSAIAENLTFGRGTSLKITETVEKGSFPENNILLGNNNIFDNFINTNRTVFVSGNVCRNIATGAPMLKIDIENDKLLLFKDNSLVKTFEYETEGAYIINFLHYADKNKTFYIQFTDTPLYSLNTETFEFKTVSDSAEHMEYSKNYIYWTQNEKLMQLDFETENIQTAFDNISSYFVSSNDHVYPNRDELFAGTDIADSWTYFSSPDGKYIFGYDEKSLYALDSETKETLYTIPIQDTSCDMVFSDDGKAVIYTYSTYGEISYRCFDAKSGEIIDKKDFKPGTRTEYHPDVSLSNNHYLDISRDGKNIAYTKDDRTVILKSLENGSEIELKHSAEIRNLCFRNDGEVLWVYLTSGTIHTWAVCDGKYMPEISGEQFIFDPYNPQISLIFDDEKLFRPNADRSAFEQFYESETGYIRLWCQTKDYFVMTESESILDYDGTILPNVTWVYDKRTHELTQPQSSTNDIPLLECYDYENNIICDFGSGNIFQNLDTDEVFEKQLSPEIVDLFDAEHSFSRQLTELQHLVFCTTGNIRTVYLVDISGDKVSQTELGSISDDKSMTLIADDKSFLLSLDNRIIKYSFAGEVLCELTLDGYIAEQYTQAQPGPSAFICADTNLEKICYLEETENILVVKELASGKDILRRKLGEKTLHIPSDNGSIPIVRDNYAFFSENGEHILITYFSPSADDLTSEIINLAAGKPFMRFSGAPIFVFQQWSDIAVKASKHGEFGNSDIGNVSDTDIYSVTRLFGTKEELFSAANEFIQFTDKES